MRAASFYWNSVDGKVRSEMFPEHPIMFEQIESKKASLDGVKAQSRTLKQSNSRRDHSFSSGSKVHAILVVRMGCIDFAVVVSREVNN